LKPSNIFNLIVKFLHRETRQGELEQLENWIQDERNTPFFNRIVKIDYLVTLCMGDYNLQQAKASIRRKIEVSKRKGRIKVLSRMGIAASLLFLVGIFIFQKNNVQPVIESGFNKAVLTFDNGDQIVLEKGKKFKTESIQSDGENLVYSKSQSNKNAPKSPSYNNLTIPRGGQFFVELSDGTAVWLNSETKIKFPTKFIEGKTRVLTLEYGEVYLDVSPSSQHAGSKFIVLSKNQEIEVFGTQFNIKAYEQDSSIVTTLVEGEILLKTPTDQTLLKPNQQSKVTASTSKITVEEVDALQIVSWKNGLFAFEQETLGEMMKILSRWYNVEVVFETAVRKNYTFTGILERSQSLAALLEIIATSSGGEVKFEISDQSIIIK